MKLRLPKGTREQLLIKKKAESAFRKLSNKKLTPARRARLKEVMASGLREFPTPAEAKMIPLLKPLGFEHCKVVIGYIPDFVNECERIIIEIDGSVHDSEKVKERDREKDCAFRMASYRVLRFTNVEVATNPDLILATVKKVLNQ